MGAEVIKVEEPIRGDYLRSLTPQEDGVSVAFESLNRGKKSIALNLETKQGQEILNRLLTTADVLLESYRPGTAKRLGCDFESVRKVNPRIIYCSLTSFGQTGPYKDLPSHDINVLALSGFLSLNGEGKPVVPAVQVGDLAGGVLAAFSVATALFARQQRNEAQYIDASMLDVLLSWLTVPLALHLDKNTSMLAGELPFYRLYLTKDSRFLSVAAIEPQFWAGLCRLIQRPDLIPDQFSPEPRRTEIIEAFQSVIATKTADEWFKLMQEKKLPCTPLLNLDEVLKDPQVRERNMILDKALTATGQRAYIGSPCKIAGQDEFALNPSPRLGQDSSELLKEVGYSASEIQGFVEAGIIEQR
jgi:crotonobetainyl-CoA:carnitine CoA-transferase CaiB-like acyl-CoA transferase